MKEWKSTNYHATTEKAWDRAHKSGWKYRQGYEFFLFDFIRKHKREIGKNILDIGSGQGRNLIPLAKQGYNLSGIDISKEGLGITKETLKKENLKASLFYGKSSKLPFRNESFDFIFSIGTIHHGIWEDIKKSFREITRVLKKNKYFLLQARSIKDTDMPRKQIKDYGYTAVDAEGLKKGVVQHYFTKRELSELAKENGFKIIVKPKEKLVKKRKDTARKSVRFWTVFKKNK